MDLKTSDHAPGRRAETWLSRPRATAPRDVRGVRHRRRLERRRPSGSGEGCASALFHGSRARANPPRQFFGKLSETRPTDTVHPFGREGVVPKTRTCGPARCEYLSSQTKMIRFLSETGSEAEPVADGSAWVRISVLCTGGSRLDSVGSPRGSDSCVLIGRRALR